MSGSEDNMLEDARCTMLCSCTRPDASACSAYLKHPIACYTDPMQIAHADLEMTMVGEGEWLQ